MKIGCLISSYLPKIGGAEAFTHNMAAELTKQGHYVVVVTPSRGKKFDGIFGYKIERLNPLLGRFLLANFTLGKRYVERRLSGLQKKYGFDIWQAVIGYPLGAAAVDFFNKNDIPCVLRCVGEDIQVYPPIRYGYRLNKSVDEVVRDKYKKFNALIAASESMKKDFLSLGAPAEKISVIPNGIDCAQFQGIRTRDEVRKALGVGDGQKLLLTVGRNHPKKGFDQILPIARILIRRYADFKWLLIGKNCGEIKKAAGREGLDGHFIIKEIKAKISPAGILEIPGSELIGYYKASDIFVFPTCIELFAKVLIEAMAAALPIVTTDAPGANEMIEHGVTGLKNKVKDTEGMAESIMKIFSDKTLEKQLRENAILTSKSYDWNTIVERYAELYKKLI